MATAEIARNPGPHHYLWWFPGSPVKLHLSLGVVRQIKDRILHARPDVSDEGLLFGEIANGVNEILDFVPAREDVATLVAGLPPASRGSLVGYYRTENSETLRLSAQDRELARECFAKPFVVFLIIHRNRLGSLTATFFFHDRECRMAEFAFLEFPFDPVLLAAEQSGRMQRSHEANERPVIVPKATETPDLVTAPPAAAAIDQPKRGFIRKATLWMAVLASAIGAGVLLNDGSAREQLLNLRQVISNRLATSRPLTPAASPSAPHPTMSLHAVRQNSDLVLTWNRESAWITKATSGALTIIDGESTRVVPFDSARLRDGSLLYSPKADQILMELTVSTPADSYTESVTVILPAGQEARTLPAPAPKAIVAMASPPLAKPPDPDRKPAKRFVAPAFPKDASRPVPSLQEPPAVNERPAATVSLPSVLSAISSSLERAPAPLPVSIARPSPPPAPMAASTYEPALAIVKTQPKVPPELRPLLYKNLTVEVHVTIDKTGKVLHSEAIPQRNVSRLLLNAVVDASRTWRFLPAMQNHEPVASESIVQFVFNP